MIGLVFAAILAFASTNIDDLFVLLLFFGQRRTSEVVLGQYLGFGAIALASLVVSAGALLVRPEWVGFLGLAPFAIGVKGLLALRKPREDEPERARSAVGVFQIAAVTFANGGDNIAVYAPLFARRAWPSIVAILVVFGVMVAVWCACAHRLRRLPGLAPVLDRYGHRIAPVVLLGLGAYVFVAEGTAAYVLSAWSR